MAAIWRSRSQVSIDFSLWRIEMEGMKMAKPRWSASPVEIEQKRRERGMRLSSGVTEHRPPGGAHYYSVRSESAPSKQHKVEWDRSKRRWVCRCLDSFHHQATQYSSGPNPYRCSHWWAISTALERGTIFGVDSLQAARQRFRDGGAKETLRGMAIDRSRHHNTAGVTRGRKSTRGRR